MSMKANSVLGLHNGLLSAPKPSTRQGNSQCARPRPRSTQQRVNCASTTKPAAPPPADFNQWVREGHTEAEYVQKQCLTPWDASKTADVAVVGCGPAGLALAAETASRGLSVVLIGEDAPFVNNYGVWVDEFEAVGLKESLEKIWPRAVCFFGEEQEVAIDRRYGRVDLDKLYEILIDRCKEGGVEFHQGFVEDIDTNTNSLGATLRCKDSSSSLKARLVTLASGAAAGKFLKFEADVPSPGAQTAYGIEVEIEGYGERYPEDRMLFMDYRRHHSGLWPSTASHIKVTYSITHFNPRCTQLQQRGKHPDGGDGLWTSHGEVPSFLYAMPLGPDRVFLEETCLVAKPPLPFSQLKTRLTRRMEAMGLTVKQIYDEEWSYIPVGGPLPIGEQSITAFGAAANLIHPSSGYSISRSLTEVPNMANAIQTALASNKSIQEMSEMVWSSLWSQEKRTQASFHVFGMELLAQLELAQINEFFRTFFRLPPYYWKGFLSSSITSFDLLVFAVITFIIAPPSIKARLVAHLILDPSGGHMIRKYFTKYRTEIENQLQK